jgi:DNA-binding transcriptional regulator YhcF (GntR family)
MIDNLNDNNVKFLHLDDESAIDKLKELGFSNEQINDLLTELKS